MPAWRVLVHALDRTGPPVLARSFLRWLAEYRPDDRAEVVAVRGGPMIDDMVRLAPVHVLLDPEERWDPTDLDPERVTALRARLSTLEPADATLAVSVSSAQALPLLDDDGPLVTWVVEQGEDLHWLDAPLGLRERTTRWLAGSESSRAELMERLPGTDVHLAPEFVDDPGPPDSELAQRCRASLGVRPDETLVVGAGIATFRKAPDLFLEVALAHQRHGERPSRFVWIGGERDVLHAPVGLEAGRLGLQGWQMMESVVDLTPWLAAADVFLHTARLDAYPLVCLHAALAGTPVLTFSGVGGTDEMFGPEALGAPYPDVEALAELIDQLTDKPFARDVATRQQARVRERATAQRCAPRVHELLEGALVPHG